MAETATTETAKPETPRKDKRPARKSGRLGRILLLLAIVAVLAIAGFFLWRYLNTYESTDDAEVDGHIEAISARISGHVMDVEAEDEQLVKAGDVLVRIDPNDYQVALAKAEADLADAEASLETSRLEIPITSMTTDSQLKTAHSGRVDSAAFLSGAQRQLDASLARLETARAQVR